MSRRDRREETLELEPEAVPEPEAAPWWTGVGGADRVEDVEAEESWRTTRAGERSIVVDVIVVVEDDLLGAPSSWPRIFSRTLGMHQILFGSHRTPSATPDNRLVFTFTIQDLLYLSFYFYFLYVSLIFKVKYVFNASFSVSHRGIQVFELLIR